MCLGYITVTEEYGVAQKTATVNNVNLQQCDGSDAQKWAYVSPWSQVTEYTVLSFVLLLC